MVLALPAGQSGPRHNGNEGVTPHPQEFQDWSLTPECSLVPHLGQSSLFLGEENLTISQGMQSVYSMPHCQKNKVLNSWRAKMWLKQWMPNNSDNDIFNLLCYFKGLEMKV